MIQLIGYGLWPERHLTLEGIDALKKADHICCLGHSDSIYHWLRSVGLPFSDLRKQYELNRLRSEIYRRIAEHVFREAADYKVIAYLTYGHPLFFESPSRMLLDLARERGIQTEVFPGVSFLDTFLAAHRISVNSRGYTVMTAEACAAGKIHVDARVPLILAQLGVLGHRRARPNTARQARSYVRLAEWLGTIYPASHRVVLFDNDSTGSGLIHEQIQLGQLPAYAHLFSYSTSVYIPPIHPRRRS